MGKELRGIIFGVYLHWIDRVENLSRHAFIRDFRPVGAEMLVKMLAEGLVYIDNDGFLHLTDTGTSTVNEWRIANGVPK